MYDCFKILIIPKISRNIAYEKVFSPLLFCFAFPIISFCSILVNDFFLYYKRSYSMHMQCRYVGCYMFLVISDVSIKV